MNNTIASAIKSKRIAKRRKEDMIGYFKISLCFAGVISLLVASWMYSSYRTEHVIKPAIENEIHRLNQLDQRLARQNGYTISTPESLRK